MSGKFRETQPPPPPGSACADAGHWRSTIRQVPDNQEVYIDKNGFTSIIFDITERVGGKGSSEEVDGQAIVTHLEDLVGDDLERVKVWNTTPTMFSRLEYVTHDLPIPLLLAGAVAACPVAGALLTLPAAGTSPPSR